MMAISKNMPTCLIVSTKPYLFDTLASIEIITDRLSLTQAQKFKPGFDIIISDTKLKAKPYVIELTQRPISLAKAVQDIETQINYISKQLHLRDNTLDITTRILSNEDSSIQLTEIECKILSSLITSQGHSRNREGIKTSVLGYNEEVQTSTIENHIYHLRQKLISGNFMLSIDKVGDEYRLLSL